MPYRIDIFFVKCLGVQKYIRRIESTFHFGAGNESAQLHRAVFFDLSENFGVFLSGVYIQFK